MPTVLQVVDSLDPGGAERHVVDLARALRARGDDVHLACSAGGPLGVDAGVPVHVLGPTRVKRRTCPDYAAALGRLVRVLRPDVVHAHIHASAVAAARAVAGTGVPLVVTEHTEAPWRSPLDRRVAQRAFERAAALVAVSPAVGALLRHGYGLPAPRVHVVPPAITPARVAPAVRPLRHRGRPLVGRVCRLAPEKGVDGFLRALALVREQRPDVAGIVVGDGPCAGELLALRRALGLEAAVDLLGHRADARALIGSLDVMALTSHSEGSPLVVAEALAAGVPVVATAVGGVPDQLAGGAGLLVPAGDPVALAAALLSVLQDPARAERLRAAARERARETSHARMVDTLRALYARVARPARTRAGA